MASATKAQGFSPELRAAVFHFVVFASTGVSSVYFAIWLTRRGISPDEIGIINAVPVVVMLLINLFVGRLADKASDWRQAIVILALIAGAVPIGLFFVSGFWGILLIWTLCIVPAYSLSPITDAATLRMTERRGTDFGFVRAWGTVGYMASAASAGPLIGWLGEGAFLPLFVVWSLLRALLSLQLPLFRGLKTEEKAVTPVLRATGLRQLLKPWFVLAILGLGMHLSIHGILSAFAALVWSAEGIPDALIGPLIAVMAGAEAIMMFVWTRLGWTLSARHMILFAALVGVVRWTAMAFSPPVWVLFGLQMLHAITFAIAFFGGMKFIANWADDAIAAEAQSFAFVLQQIMGVIALVLFGWCVALFGAKAWLVASAIALCGAGLVYLSLRLQPAHR